MIKTKKGITETTFGSSRLESFCKKGVLRNFRKIYRKTPAQESLRLWHRCFPVNFKKFLRTPFFIEHLW